jgi:hypothetical protein
MFRTPDAKNFSKPSSDFSPDPAPMQSWIEIDKLVVDSEYQRHISRRGAMNVVQIAEEFAWSKFAPVIVAPVEGGRFAIVDGQHRTMAAILRGQTQVPCHIVQADPAQQAAAYAAVNGNVTKTTPTQLFYSRLAAGDERCSAIAAVCSAAAVTMVRTNMVQSKMQTGQTVAIGAIGRCYDAHGADILTCALRCITRTADGNAGFLRSTIIEALCLVLVEHPEWQKPEDVLLSHMQKFSFPDAWEAISGGRDQIFPNTAKTDMKARIEKHLARKFGPSSRKAA